MGDYYPGAYPGTHTALPVGRDSFRADPLAFTEQILSVRAYGDVTVRQTRPEPKECVDCLVREKRCAL